MKKLALFEEQQEFEDYLVVHDLRVLPVKIDTFIRVEDLSRFDFFKSKKGSSGGIVFGATGTFSFTRSGGAYSGEVDILAAKEIAADPWTLGCVLIKKIRSRETINSFLKIAIQYAIAKFFAEKYESTSLHFFMFIDRDRNKDITVSVQEWISNLEKAIYSFFDLVDPPVEEKLQNFFAASAKRAITKELHESGKDYNSITTGELEYIWQSIVNNFREIRKNASKNIGGVKMKRICKIVKPYLKRTAQIGKEYDEVKNEKPNKPTGIPLLEREDTVGTQYDPSFLAEEIIRNTRGGHSIAAAFPTIQDAFDGLLVKDKNISEKQ
ncbi:MAG: hypothetical protein WC942_11730, partial [Clostridia bacterium]